jgi:16S rRNA (uracil1498-N3)-methyltransferase
MQLFYSAHTDGDIVFLDAEETRHCKVLRKSIGDPLHVIDGKGLLLECTIQEFKKESSVLQVNRQTHFERQRPYYFHLYIAPTKQNERMEWMLEKAIETGLDEISFIETAHSEKTRINITRLEKIAISAIKQSGQYYLPKINPLLPLAGIQPKGLVLLAHCGKGEKIPFRQALKIVTGDISVLIGPEGDFSGKEIADMIQAGAQPVSLGNTRLRTETAGLYCAVMLNGLS